MLVKLLMDTARIDARDERTGAVALRPAFTHRLEVLGEASKRGGEGDASMGSRGNLRAGGTYWRCLYGQSDDSMG